jgi:hypothetical protein
MKRGQTFVGEHQRAVLALVDQPRRATATEPWAQFEVSSATLRNELRETIPDPKPPKMNRPRIALATAIRRLLDAQWLGETSLAQLTSAGIAGCPVSDADGFETTRLREERGAEVLAVILAAVAKGA